MRVLAFAEQRDGKLKASAFEAVAKASKLAGSSANAAALIVGKGIGHLAAELAGFGVDKVYVVEADELGRYNIDHYSKCVQSALHSFGAEILIAAATPMGRDLCPRLAARLDAGIVTDVVELDLNGQHLSALKPMYAGKCLAKLSLSGSGLQIASIRPNVFQAEKSGVGSASVEALSVALDANSRIVTREIRKGSSERADLTEASIIVSGGRALGNAENFGILQKCADVIGATVGASRAAVDSGYARHDMQVGQTGKTVNPNLYIACGISGSIQHMAGMRTSKVIVAINTDPEAPIFGVANYGIVGDLFEVVPKLTEELKKVVES